MALVDTSRSGFGVAKQAEVASVNGSTSELAQPAPNLDFGAQRFERVQVAEAEGRLERKFALLMGVSDTIEWSAREEAWERDARASQPIQRERREAVLVRLLQRRCA